MEAATHPPLTVVQAAGEPAPSTRVRVEADRIVIDRLVVRDPALAAFLGERAPRIAAPSSSARSASA